MVLYKYLFFVIYRTIRSIELDLITVKHDDRCLETIFVMTIIQAFNILTVIEPSEAEGGKVVFITIFLFIFLFNCFIFWDTKRLRELTNLFTVSKPSKAIRWTVLSYLIGGLLAFIVVRLLN